MNLAGRAADGSAVAAGATSWASAKVLIALMATSATAPSVNLNMNTIPVLTRVSCHPSLHSRLDIYRRFYVGALAKVQLCVGLAARVSCGGMESKGTTQGARPSAAAIVPITRSSRI